MAQHRWPRFPSARTHRILIRNFRKQMISSTNLLVILGFLRTLPQARNRNQLSTHLLNKSAGCLLDDLTSASRMLCFSAPQILFSVGLHARAPPELSLRLFLVDIESPRTLQVTHPTKSDGGNVIKEFPSVYSLWPFRRQNNA